MEIFTAFLELQLFFDFPCGKRANLADVSEVLDTVSLGCVYRGVQCDPM